MPGSEHYSQQPFFFVLALISAVLTIGFYWGNRINKKRFESIFDELIEMIKPEKQEYGNIGGSKEYYCDFTMKKGSPLERVDAKFTFLPRHLWPYLPIALLIDKYDSLLMALHFKEKLRDEGHIIEADYAKLGKAKIANADQLNKAFIKWGKHNYDIYYRSKKTFDRLKGLIDGIDDPGLVKHIALLPGQKKCFIFLVPQKGRVAKDMATIYQWMLALD
ncbi:MAG: hypothetical protein C0394_09230 [Syntrophus sp. (in: bacteria)]|nr:hypothetical protein [Syntrophus sp. (in: bacteria)]